MSSQHQDQDQEVGVGIDTHADVHMVGVIDRVGREIAHQGFPTTEAGYQQLETWIASWGSVLRIGMEGTGTYGAELCRQLTAHGFDVVEVDRADRKTRRFQGKSDPIDAYAAARAAISGRASAIPKARDGNVEMIRVLRVARNSAIKARVAAIVQLKATIVSAPAGLREGLAGIDKAALIDRCARFRVARTGDGHLDSTTSATKAALKTLARRVRSLDDEISGLDSDLGYLVEATAPTLVSLFGVGTDVAGQLLVTAGDNPERLKSSAAFAHLCGVAPVPASSGRTTRHRLNRGGDRHANAALYRITLCRLRHDDTTRAYRARRAAEQKSTQDIIRCLKRYIAREVYQAIRADFQISP